jgi:hypothetical protein
VAVAAAAHLVVAAALAVVALPVVALLAVVRPAVALLRRTAAMRTAPNQVLRRLLRRLQLRHPLLLVPLRPA